MPQDSIDEIKAKKLEELQKKQQDQLKQQQERQIREFQNQVDTLENFIRQKFTKEALSRYGNLKVAHPEKALQLIAVLAQIIQNGSLQGPISDEQLRKLLEKLSPVKKEFKIIRR